jgi:hypothetical protein
MDITADRQQAFDGLVCSFPPEIEGVLHRSLLSFCFPQCVVLREVLDSLTPCRLIACIMPISAKIIGPLFSAACVTQAENRIKDRADRQFELKKLDRLSQCIRSFEGLATWERAAERLDFRRAAFDRQLGELASRAAEADSVIRPS